jgi:uncharacterized protein with PQ loop repeat
LTGFLVQVLTLVVSKKSKFLTDCRTRQRQSGFPVIAFRLGSFNSTNKNVRASTSLESSEVGWGFQVFIQGVFTQSLIWVFYGIEMLLENSLSLQEIKIQNKTPVIIHKKIEIMLCS